MCWVWGLVLCLGVCLFIYLLGVGGFSMLFSLLVTLHVFLAGHLSHSNFPCLFCILGDFLILLLFRLTALLPHHPIISCSLAFGLAQQICFIALFILHLISFTASVIFCHRGILLLTFPLFILLSYIFLNCKTINSVASMPISPSLCVLYLHHPWAQLYFQPMNLFQELYQTTVKNQDDA